MNKLTITGQAGELRWGYRSAASLASWSIASDGNGGQSLTAQIVSKDAFAVTQAPLTFRVPRQSGTAWEWSVKTLQISGTTLTASLDR
jgi:hypothetical protein